MSNRSNPSQPDRLRTEPPPLFTVVIPVLDGGREFRRSLSDLAASSFEDWELIVVDDGSKDGSDRVALALARLVLSTSGLEGPASARNLGARHAQGDYLFFLDADCSVHPETLALAARRLRAEPELDALFGSYDARPSAPGLVSRFKNLQHHFVHQTGCEDAETFWAGCGFIRRSTFEKLGGFNAARFKRPSIEDIELGYRLRADGKRIRLDKTIQVTHHKAWKLANWLKTDLLDRGVPWVMLSRQYPQSRSALNLSRRGRASVLLGLLVLAGLLSGLFDPRGLVVSLVSALALLALNARFYRLLYRSGGPSLMIGGVFLHWIYQIVCALSVGSGSVKTLLGRSSYAESAGR